jgi:thiol-disulfide isomerase/thioredoxin
MYRKNFLWALLLAPIVAAVLFGAVVSAQDAVETTPPATEEVDPFEVPDGTPSELLEYVANLLSSRPRITSYEEYVEFLGNRSEAILEATSKILASEEELTEEQLGSTIAAKLGALQVLAQQGQEEAETALFALPEELKAAGQDEYARLAQAMVFQVKIGNAANGDVEEFEAVLLEAQAAIQALGADIGQAEMQVIQTATRASEAIANRLEDPSIAVDVYTGAAELLKGTGIEELAAQADQLLGAARRLGLPGSKMEFVGYTLDDEAVDIADLEGQVVLVDFWATWCGPCIGEIPNMTKMYEAYHEDGFEIVGVSVDRDLEALASFIEERETPWIILADNQPEKEDYESIARNYGVTGIPTMILIGKDGKVISTSARGAALEEALAEIFGPIEEEE